MEHCDDTLDPAESGRTANLQEMEAETKKLLYSRRFDTLSSPGSWSEAWYPTETDLKEIEEFLSLGLSACSSILREYVEQLPDDAAGGIYNGFSWGYSNIRIHLRETWMALTFECYHLSIKKTDWRPWAGQYNPLDEADPVQPLEGYDRDFILACLNAFCVRGSFQGFNVLVSGRFPQVINLIAETYPRTVAVYLFAGWLKDNTGDEMLEGKEHQLVVEAYKALKIVHSQEQS